MRTEAPIPSDPRFSRRKLLTVAASSAFLIACEKGTETGKPIQQTPLIVEPRETLDQNAKPSTAFPTDPESDKDSTAFPTTEPTRDPNPNNLPTVELGGAWIEVPLRNGPDYFPKAAVEYPENWEVQDTSEDLFGGWIDYSFFPSDSLLRDEEKLKIQVTTNVFNLPKGEFRSNFSDRVSQLNSYIEMTGPFKDSYKIELKKGFKIAGKDFFQVTGIVPELTSDQQPIPGSKLSIVEYISEESGYYGSTSAYWRITMTAKDTGGISQGTPVLDHMVSSLRFLKL